MSRIVTSTYRYKRPPRKRKPRTIEPAIVTSVDPKKSRRPTGSESGGQGYLSIYPAQEARRPQHSR